mgnify:CR=1 FL=1
MSISVSPFLTDEPDTEMFNTDAPSRFAATSKDTQVLVEFSKDKVESHDKHLSHKASEICFICSEDFSNSIKGQDILIEIAKGYKSSSIVVISQTDDAVSL